MARSCMARTKYEKGESFVIPVVIKRRVSLRHQLGLGLDHFCDLRRRHLRAVLGFSLRWCIDDGQRLQNISQHTSELWRGYGSDYNHSADRVFLACKCGYILPLISQVFSSSWHDVVFLFGLHLFSNEAKTTGYMYYRGNRRSFEEVTATNSDDKELSETRTSYSYLNMLL